MSPPGRGGGPVPGRILVTGGGGFIGANLVRLLLDEGARVTVLDDWSAGRREYLAGLEVDFVDGDVRDAALVQEAARGHDGVVHLAAQTGVPGSLADPRKDCEVNVVGTLNVLEACRSAAIERLVFASSNAPLGRQRPPATEDKAPLPVSPYGASKLAAEAYCLAYHGSWGLGAIALRFGNVYGPFCAHKSSVVAKFFGDMTARGELTIDGDGRQTRDFIYVGDLCKAVLLALGSEVGGEVFQIATGIETSVLELASLVQRVAGEEARVGHGPSRQADIRRNYASIQKVRAMLGWEPEVGLEEGLGHTWRWLSANLGRRRLAAG